MPVRSLPSHPNLEHLKYQAKDLLRAHAAGRMDAAQRLREFHPRFSGASDSDIFAAHLTLSDAQLTIAREHGFSSWTRLKRHIDKSTLADQLSLRHHDRIEDADFRRAVELLDAGDAPGLQAHLKRHLNLSRQQVVFEGGNYFRDPTLLEFIAENPTRRGRMPDNIVAVAKVIIDAGVTPSSLNETLGLVASSSVARECGKQLPLIDLLCQHGADAASAARVAALHGEFASVEALLAHGAKLDLPMAAALGRTNDARRQITAASSDDRHLALALAAQFGRVAIVRMLLDAGEDPNRYNPVGGHSHTTPLHQASGFGHGEVVRLLVEHGARLDLKDVLWGATPEGWAEHEGHTEIVAYLSQQFAGSKG